MNQKDRQELQELKEHQFEMSRNISRILNILEGDEKMGIVGHGNRLNHHEERLNEIETQMKVTKGQKAVAVLFISSVATSVTWLVNFLVSNFFQK